MLNIITRCSRVENLKLVQESLEPLPDYVNWFVIVDTNSVQKIPTEILTSIRCTFKFCESNNDLLYPAISKLIKKNIPPLFENVRTGSVEKSYVYILDDDNIIHPDFFKFYESIKNTGKGYIFNQKVDGKDFTGLDIRVAKEENMKLQGVDAAQFLFPVDFFKYDFEPDYAADGIFIEKVYPEIKDRVEFVDKTLCYYNYLEKSTHKDYYLPKVLYIGEDTPKLQSIYVNDYNDRRLNVVYEKDDSNILDNIVEFDPDAIITKGIPSTNSTLFHAPADIRNRWYNMEEETFLMGDAAYTVGMNYILSNNHDRLVSFFTSTYNTGDRILDTFSTLRKQTYKDWEWVIVDDSNDEGKTYKILKNIEKLDYRVKVYSLDKKSGGIVGEAKYRAAALTKGSILAELDHDDFLTEDCAFLLYKAYSDFPDAGFYYTDAGEVFKDYTPIIYPSGFALGYGRYEKGSYDNHTFDYQITPNINPLTIRHIVGVPNHIRAWKRSTYFAIGGHNRRLTIADDYELIIRTFLQTKFVKIPKMCYIQFRYDDGERVNTHETSRKDIQRRVDTIMRYYNDKINDRFAELGIKDWAYEFDRHNPLGATPQFNKNENSVNYTLTL